MPNPLPALVALVVVASGVLLTPTVADAAPARLQASRTSVFLGDTVKFTGRVKHGKAKRAYSLQIKTNGRWRVAAKGKTKRGGTFALTRRMAKQGKHTFRVVSAKSKTKTVTVTVKKPQPAPGSMQAPYRLGEWVTLKDGWRVRFDGSRLGDVPEQDEPPTGYEYALVSMTFKRTGSTSATPFWDIDLAFVGSDAVVYDAFTTVNGTEYYCTGDGSDWIDAPELYPGGEATGTECFLVKESAYPGGLWRIRGDTDSGYEQFFIRP